MFMFGVVTNICVLSQRLVEVEKKILHHAWGDTFRIDIWKAQVYVYVLKEKQNVFLIYRGNKVKCFFTF